MREINCDPIDNNLCYIKIKLQNPKSKQVREYVALIDTGSNTCAVSDKVVEELLLTPVGKNCCASQSGLSEHNNYRINIIFNSNTNIIIPNLNVLQFHKTLQKQDIIIGMNVLNKGVLYLDNLSYSPPLQIFSFDHPPKPIY